MMAVIQLKNITIMRILYISSVHVCASKDANTCALLYRIQEGIEENKRKETKKWRKEKTIKLPALVE